MREFAVVQKPTGHLTLVMANSICAHQVCDRITIGVKDSVGDTFTSPAEWNKLGEFLGFL